MRTMEITLHVSIDKIPSQYVSDELYDSTMSFIKEKVAEIVEGLEGNLYDLEIK